MWAVHDTGHGDIEIFNTLEEAEKCYKKWKEIDGCEGVEDGTEIYIFQAIKKAVLVEDKEIDVDPKVHGFNKWVQFVDIYLDKQKTEKDDEK